MERTTRASMAHIAEQRKSSLNMLAKGAGPSLAPPPTARPSLTNSRGDVGSHAAVLHAALGVRLYQLVNLVIDRKISKAAWPAWNAMCLKLRTNSEMLKQRALYRLPRIYQTAVHFLVHSALLTDTMLIAAHAGRLLRHGHSDPEWRTHALFGAVIDLILNLLLTWCLCVFLDAIDDMQTPFGGNSLDMPGLSYVTAAAELSLRTVTSSGKKSDRTSKLFEHLNGGLDESALLRGLNRKQDTKKEDLEVWRTILDRESRDEGADDEG